MKSNSSLVSFQALLISLCLLLFAPTLTTAEWLSTSSRLLYTFTMISCLYLVSTDRKELLIGIAIFVPTFFTKWMISPFGSIDAQLLAYCVFQIFFLGYVMRIVYYKLLLVRAVNQEIIYASVVLYLLFGVCLALVYYAILIIEPTAFGSAVVLDTNDPHSVTEVLHELLYFSFVTQTTLGYGDISPTLAVARTTATIQAMMGQLYFAIVVARLVGINAADATVESER